MDKKNVVYTYNGILFINKNLKNYQYVLNMNESQKYYTMWKKLTQNSIYYMAPPT